MALIFINRYYAPDRSATAGLLTDLSTAFAASGRDVAVITSRQLLNDPQARLPARETLDGVRIHRVWTTRFGRAGLLLRAIDYASFYLVAGMRLWRLCGPGDTIVAKTDPPLISVIAAWVARRRGARLVNWLQDVFPEVAIALGLMPSHGLVTRCLTWLRDYSLANAEANVVLGDDMRARLGGFPTVIIPNWADGESIQPIDPGASPERSKRGFGHRLVVAYAGNLGRAHEFDTLLGAAARLVKDDRIVFWIVGNGAQRRHIAQRVEAGNLTNVLLEDYQPRRRLNACLAAADIHLVTLRPELEGYIVPSKIYNIMAAGRGFVYIGGERGDVTQLARNAGCAVAIPAGADAALANRLSGFAQDRSGPAALGARARTYFAAHFTRDLAIDRWRALLDPPHD